jgi:hypothetical protein
MGIYHLISAILCILHNNFAPYFAAIAGIGLIIWILVQVYAIGLNSYLQPVYFAVGFSELLLSLILIKRKYVLKHKITVKYTKRAQLVKLCKIACFITKMWIILTYSNFKKWPKIGIFARLNNNVNVRRIRRVEQTQNCTH